MEFRGRKASDELYVAEMDVERRGSKNRVLERSISYSEAIGNASQRSSFEIPNLVNTDVYLNEELKRQHRISQTVVEGKEITFHNLDPKSSTDGVLSDASTSSSEEEHLTSRGLVMTIDVENESPKTSETTRYLSDTSTRALVSSSSHQEDIYDRIELAESVFEDTATVSSTGLRTHSRGTPYTRRKKRTTHRQRRGPPTKSRRAVFKDGEENVPVKSNIPLKSIKYMRDIVNTVINSKWRFLILFMVGAHFVFWLVFAGVWYAVTSSYQDDLGDGKEHCVTGTSSFAGLLMMSVETQMTIGYGTRYPSEECPEAIIVMVLEIIAGTALSGGLSSLLFTKLIRPNRHVTSVGFSKKAVVCLRDGQLSLQFRVWDLKNVHLINSSITAYILKPIRTLEGEFVQNYIHQLKLKQARAFLLWPVTVVHVIDNESPLYDFSAQDMMDYRFEIVVSLTGSSKNMGTVTQSRTSYLSKEIIWGYRFKNVLRYSKKEEAYVIDVDNLNTVEQVETPLCSASRLKSFEEDTKFTFSPTEMSQISQSPTIMSLPSTISKAESIISKNGSTHSTPSLNRMAGTQRSFGWHFQKEYAAESRF